MAGPLAGRLVVLEPLAEGHREGLWRAADDDRVWRLMTVRAGADRASFDAWFDQALVAGAAGVELPFAITRAGGGEEIGSSRLMTLRPAHRGAEIGGSWLNPEAWGSGANAETKLLLLEHAFDALGCIRVEFKTEAVNERARAALLAIGARFEGILRKHMLVRGGELRDSAYYSVIDDEWPAVRAHLQARVAAAAERR